MDHTLYVTVQSLKDSLSLSGQTFADPDVNQAILAASRGIDEATGRRFYQDTDTGQVRYFTPDSCDLVRIMDLVTLTSLATDASGGGTFTQAWTVNTDFILHPLNAPADGKPYTRVRRNPQGNWFFNPDQPRSVKITGKYGWTEFPPGIVEATTIIASKLLRRVREAPFGVVSMGLDGAAVRIARTDPDVCMLLDPYALARLI